MSEIPPPPPPDVDNTPTWLSRNKRLVIVAAGSLIIGVVGGAALGYNLNDPTRSAAYTQLQNEKATVEAERDSAVQDKKRLNEDLTKSRQETQDATEAQRQAWADIASKTTDVQKKERAVQDREDELNELEKTLEEREKAVGILEVEQEKNRIYEGIWTVGVDVDPGTYRLAEAFDGDMCYWSIEKTGSNGALIDNDIVTGGRPSVTLKSGQDFRTQGCGPWDKQ